MSDSIQTVSTPRLRELAERFRDDEDSPRMSLTLYDIRDARFALRELQRLREQVRVPVEPTVKMLDAAYAVWSPALFKVAEIYRAMLAASKQPQGELDPIEYPELRQP